jgi:hypothetical protein
VKVRHSTGGNIDDTPATDAGRDFLANLVGRFGHAAADPVSWELTVSDVIAIEQEAAADLRDAYNAEAARLANDALRQSVLRQEAETRLLALREALTILHDNYTVDSVTYIERVLADTAPAAAAIEKRIREDAVKPWLDGEDAERRLTIALEAVYGAGPTLDAWKDARAILDVLRATP